MMIRRVLIFVLAAFLLACSGDESSEPNTDNFDREAMLRNWADNIIIPSYSAYNESLSELKMASDSFIAFPNQKNLNEIRIKWENAYLAWQRVSMFEIGKAEEIALRDYTNIFPTDVQNIEAAIAAGEYNFELPSNRDIQGFPALDYLLFGTANNDQGILSNLQKAENAKYMSDLVNRLISISNEVLNDWENGYRDEFLANSGSDAASSVNKLVNDYMFYYEKALRAGKIGIPAGIFSAAPRQDLVEAPYRSDLSQKLCIEALSAVIDFYEGKHYGSEIKGESLRSYLDFLNNITETDNLGLQITNQFDLAREKIQALDPDFQKQIATDNSAMLEAYDALQANVILMKVDMFQAMNIRVDYVDADGD